MGAMPGEAMFLLATLPLQPFPLGQLWNRRTQVSRFIKTPSWTLCTCECVAGEAVGWSRSQSIKMSLVEKKGSIKFLHWVGGVGGRRADCRPGVSGSALQPGADPV